MTCKKKKEKKPLPTLWKFAAQPTRSPIDMFGVAAEAAAAEAAGTSVALGAAFAFVFPA